MCLEDSNALKLKKWMVIHIPPPPIKKVEIGVMGNNHEVKVIKLLHSELDKQREHRL